MDLAAAAVEKVDMDEPTVDEAPLNVDVIIARAVPTIEVPVRSATGKVLRVRHVVDKRAIFALPSGDLRGRASIWGPRPGGRVLVYDRDGKLLARFNDVEQGAKHLKAAGVDATKLIGWPKPDKKPKK